MKSKRSVLVAVKSIIFLVTATLSSTGQTFDHSFVSFGKLLSQNVSEGLVDYGAIKREPEILRRALAELAGVPSGEFSSFSAEQQLAFWINAYNLFTIQAIVEHYPTESIKDIDGVWNKLTFQVAGRELTLDNIEHDILRKDFKEPRIHVAIVCASISCPELWDRPFTADSINSQLESRSRIFVQDSSRNRWSDKEQRLYLSKILDWYGNDFKELYLPAAPFPAMDGKDGATAHFFYSHSSDSIRKQMTDHSFKVKHLKYDWSLNERRE